jgi:hypothetical protein
MDFELNFIPDIYRLKNLDLKNFSDKDLLTHFNNFGIKEGRISCNLMTRGGLKLHLNDFINKFTSYQYLEISPFASPFLINKDKKIVKYFDVLNRDELIKRANFINVANKTILYDPSKIPEIDYVNTQGSLCEIDQKFKVVFSSHTIEHIPDIINHINEVGSLLSDNSFYVLIIPDKRYCFDHYLHESNVAQMIDSYHQKNKKHSLTSIIEHKSLTTHNDPIKHWREEHGDYNYKNLAKNIKETYELYKENIDYIDVHKWQFTPTSFEFNMNLLFEMNFINLKPHRVYHTPKNNFEFISVLKHQI